MFFMLICFSSFLPLFRRYSIMTLGPRFRDCVMMIA
jgi:hypothetical protein